MDRYLYSTKPINSDDWIVGFVSRFENKFYITTIDTNNTIEIIPYTICQHIGILDKNNTRLKEYDIVKRESVNGNAGGAGLYVIKWNAGYAMFGLYDVKSKQIDTDHHNRFYKIIPEKV